MASPSVPKTQTLVTGAAYRAPLLSPMAGVPLHSRPASLAYPSSRARLATLSAARTVGCCRSRSPVKSPLRIRGRRGPAHRAKLGL